MSKEEEDALGKLSLFQGWAIKDKRIKGELSRKKEQQDLGKTK